MVKPPLSLLVLETDDVKQKTSLFSVQGKIYLVLFHGFCCFVLCHQCPVQLLLKTLKRLSTVRSVYPDWYHGSEGLLVKFL